MYWFCFSQRCQCGSGFIRLTRGTQRLQEENDRNERVLCKKLGDTFSCRRGVYFSFPTVNWRNRKPLLYVQNWTWVIIHVHLSLFVPHRVCRLADGRKGAGWPVSDVLHVKLVALQWLIYLLWFSSKKQIHMVPFEIPSYTTKGRVTAWVQ